MADPFPRDPDQRDDPARRIFVIAPGPQPLQRATKGIRAGSDGSITLRAVDDAVDTVHPVFAGERIDAVISHVTAANPSNMIIIGYA